MENAKLETLLVPASAGPYTLTVQLDAPNPICIGDITHSAQEWHDIAISFSDSTTFQLAARTAETLDAERYRYLRNAAGLEDCGPSVVSGCGDLFEYHWGAEVDEVVDEAMARWKAAGSPTPKETA